MLTMEIYSHRTENPPNELSPIYTESCFPRKGGGLCMQKMAILAMISKVLGEHSSRVYKPRSLPHRIFGSFVPM